MNKEITPSEERVGLHLAAGFTKKEIANKLGNSQRTIDRHTDNLYKKTGSRNLADITRWMMNRYTGVREDVLIHLVHDVTLIVFVGFMAWVANTVGMLDELKTALDNALTSLINLF